MSTREIRAPKRYEDSSSSVALITEDGEPSCYHEALDDADSEKWKKAMDSFTKNKTWDLVKLPKGRSVVRCKWVLKLKRNVDGILKDIR